MKYCPQCGEEWSDSFQFCPQDASPLQSEPLDRLVGQLLAKKYEILERIGRGPHGKVYRAHHRISDQTCVVKLLNPELTQDDKQLVSLRAVVRASLELRSPHTVRLYDLDYAEEFGYFLAEEYVEGHSLDNLLLKHGRLPASVSTSLLRQISESLAEAHTLGLPHGNLAASNVLLTGAVPALSAKVSDYGLARLPRASQTATDPDARTDLLLLGGLLFLMLTGEKPFLTLPETSTVLRDTEELKAALQRSEVSRELTALAFSLLGIQPGRGLSSAASVASALEQISRPALPEAEKPSPDAPAPETEGKSPAGGVPAWFSPTSLQTAEAEAETNAPPGEPKISSLRVGVFAGVVASIVLLVIWLWFRSPAPQSTAVPAPQSQTMAEPPAKEAAALPIPAFDYEIAKRENEGNPAEHPHVLVRIEGLPLFIIRDKGVYPSTIARAQAAIQALRQAADNLREKPSLQFRIVEKEGNHIIVQESLSGTAGLPIIAVTHADVYGYNARSNAKASPEDLAHWWLGRTQDYLGLFALGKAPRFITHTEDGAALLRLYETARAASANTSMSAAAALKQALKESDPKLKEALQISVFQTPEKPRN